MGLGLPPADFWSITMRETDVILKAAAEREERLHMMEAGRLYTHANLVAIGLADPKKMPKFDKAFPGPKRSKAKTPDEMLAVMSAWVSAVQSMKGN